MSTALDTKYTADELYTRIHEIVTTRGCSASEACLEVHAQLLANKNELVRWFEYHGLGWLRNWEIDQSTNRLGLFEVTPIESKLGEPTAPPKHSLPSRWSTTRGYDPLDAVIAVGNSGVRKALRDITAEDAKELAERYTKCGQTMIERGKVWADVAETLVKKNAKTVGGVKKGTFSAEVIAALIRQDVVPIDDS